MKRDSSSPLFSLRPLWLLPALLLFALPALAETVEIATAADWAAFAGRVNNGETSLDAKMTAEVKLSQDSPFVGDADSHAYSGTFDGDGHTLTVNWRFTDGTQWVAPFRFTQGCTIQNLHVTGSLESNGKFVAGFVGLCLGYFSRPTHIQNCRSSVTITCTITGDATSGGFVGHVESDSYARVLFENCLFDGSLLGPTANCCGGFVGFRPYNAYAYFNHCLFAPKEVTIGTDGSSTLSRGGMSSSSQIYSMQDFGVGQGGDASSMSPEDLASNLGSAWTVAYGRVALALFPYAITPGAVASVDGFVYQGALKNVSGLPLTGPQKVEFRLYDSATGGTPLWGRSHSVLLDANGLFNAELSDKAGDEIEGVNAINLAPILARNSATPLYVGVTVAGADGETAPRQRLLSVPYAAFAADSGTASGNFAVAGTLSSAGLGVSGNASISGDATFKGVTVTRNLGVSGKILGPGSRAAYGTAPVGAIVLWKGNSGQVPDGWKLCDGSNGTPDLRDRFVVGAGYDSRVGNSGGQARYNITIAQLPAHFHLYAGDDQLVYAKPGNTGYSANDNIEQTTGGYDAVSKYNDPVWLSRIYRTSSTGSGQSVDNRPPYYALCYIMRVK